jgi:hypothetical protein
MNETEPSQMWTSFNTESRQQLAHLWADLLYRCLQAKRLRQTGGPDEQFNQNSSPSFDPPGGGLHPPIDAQAGPS